MIIYAQLEDNDKSVDPELLPLFYIESRDVYIPIRQIEGYGGKLHTCLVRYGRDWGVFPENIGDTPNLVEVPEEWHLSILADCKNYINLYLLKKRLELEKALFDLGAL